jgi:hypothetical protein
MAKAEFVKIKFLGNDSMTGLNQRRQIMVGGHRFWTYRKFEEQTKDGSYIRPIAFYEEHKEVLSDESKFIIKFTDSKGDIPDGM